MSLEFHNLYIEDFKSFKGKHVIELDCAPGVYFVTGVNHVEPALGANGCGKSTIWDALFWCLTGKTIRAARPGASIEPWEGGAPRIGVRFTARGTEYIVGRERNPNRLWMAVGDVEEGSDVDQDTIYLTLGLDDEALRRTIIIGQFGTLFMDLKPEAQSQMFTDVLGLDIWLRSAEVAGGGKRLADVELKESIKRLERLGGQIEEATKQHQDAADMALDYDDHKKAALKYKRDLLKQKKATLDAIKLPPNHGTLSKQITAIRGRIVQITEERTDVRNLLSSIGEDTKTLREQISWYEKHAVCPECDQNITAQHKRAQIRKLKEELAAHEARITALAPKLQELTDLLDKCSHEADGLEELRDTVTANERRKSSAEAAVFAVQAEITTIENTKNPHNAQLSALAERLLNLKRDLKKEKQEKERQAALVESNALWVDAFKQIRLNLIDEALVELEVAANRHAQGLGLDGWTIAFSTEHENASGTVSTKFNASVYPPGMEEAIPWESYSGGEAQRWQLAVSFGLSEVLLSRAGIIPNIEVLDEPTQHLSQHGIDDLLANLSDRARDLNRAIFFVDHRSHDRGSFDGVLTVVKDSEGAHVVRV